VVIDDFYFVRITRFKFKTKPPLVVNPDAPAPSAIARQLFQSIPRRRLEKVQGGGAVQEYQFSFGLLPEIPESTGTFPREKVFRILAAKRFDHPRSILRSA
jgi:hypothetical protein